MGRPEPCVLFAQTFVHDIIDEFVDEVLFAEPVVIIACEFIEQNASSTCSMAKILGATSPPSLALEVFVQCEGETRFRRLCQPFLYSHSSSNVLEVEAIVTNHLVIRGTYRNLSLVVYGNTTEDLGQFNIEVDLDSSLTNTVSTVEGDLEDLPPALRPTNLTIEESTSSLKRLSLKVVRCDLHEETKQLIKLSLKILDSPNVVVPIDTVLSALLSSALVHATPSLSCAIKKEEHLRMDSLTNGGDFHHVLSEAIRQLLDVYKSLQHHSGYVQSELSTENMFLESDADANSSKQLVECFIPHFQFGSCSGNIACPELSQNKNAILLLSLALLLCSAKESCFHFVNAGCMEKLGYAFSQGMLNSITLKLMLLGVVEQATRHSIGCEGFLGWWPREDENIPPGTSEGYNLLLKLLLENQRHDVASLSTYILNRLRLYEVACRYECAVLSVLGGLSAVDHVTSITVDMLSNAKIQLKSILKLIHLRGPIEDPSPVSCASISLLLSDAGLLSYKATSALIHQSNCCFTKWDVDSHVLLLLKERGFLPLSAALLSFSTLRSEAGHLMDLFVEVASYIESIFLSFLLCRSGLLFLLNDPDISTTIILALKGANDWKKKESAFIRYASSLISKGFFRHPQEVGFIVEMHLKMINAIDRLIASTPGTEEFLWILWKLCGLSRSNCGRQALLALVQFPEALSVLMGALHFVKELDPICLTTGAAPVNLAIFHAAAEIFEVLVMDSTASSLGAWIDHANELHKMLNSSSPGSNKKDAPARLLELIDAGVVYHRNGAIGVLRYAALLASGGDAHMASTSMLTSDMMDVENVVGETSNNSDGNVIDNLLGKRITEKDFPGVILRDSAIVQLTTAFRILAFISDHSTVAAALYDEGAVMVIHAVLINCKVMLERSSNIYDYLVDEGTECNATSDLLLDHNREESLIALLIPSLVLLNNLLQKLQETKEQHRNSKLLNALLQLHREVSPKLAACAFDLSYPYPESALGYEAVCHLLVSILASWPVYGWTPGLFHCLLDNLQATSLVALGPKEICSLFCLLNDLFPDEGVWLWKNSIPMLSSVRSFAVGTILGPQKESQINWYLQTGHSEKLLTQLTPQLDKIAQIVHHCAISTLVVIQDMLRVFIIRIANLNTANGSTLLRPLLLWVSDRLSGPPTLSDVDSFKIYQILQFVAILLEHPSAKPLLLKEDGIKMFMKVLENCSAVAVQDAKEFLENRNTTKYGFPNIAWCIPVFNCITLICGYQTSLQLLGKRDRKILVNLTAGEYSLILSYILKFVKALPVGKELIACLSAFKELGTSSEGKNALLSVLVEDSELESHSDRDLKILNAREWREHPPLRFCWNAVVRSFVSQDSAPMYAVQAIGLLSSAALLYCIDGESLNSERVAAIKYLFGCGNDTSAADGFLEGNMKSIHELANLLGSEVMESTTSLLLLLQKPPDAIKVDDISGSVLLPSQISSSLSSKVHKVMDNSGERIEHYDLNEFGDAYAWECPENLRDRLTQTGVLSKRKVSSLDGPTRRARGDNASTETFAQVGFSRGSVPPAPSGPTRRDMFRQRKPNTSRPPSMHVDDYVARERNADGSINPNVIAVPRIGSSSGRPPSIHVDEFMARQRDRQHPAGVALSDATEQVKSAPPESISDAEKFSKSQQMKPDLDDDLQGIDIVFDAEEADLDDKLPFPQPDDNLSQPTSVVEQSPPHSIVEETESNANENSEFSLPNAPSASNMDENTPSEFSSSLSISLPEKLLTREPSITSEKKFPDQPDESKSPLIKSSRGFDSAAGASISGFSAPGYPKVNTAFGQAPGDSRTRHNLFSKAGAQRGATAPSAKGSFDQKFQPNQPPLPPLPPPQTISISLSQNVDPTISQSSSFATSMADMQSLIPPGFHVQGEYVSPYTSSSGVPTASSSPLSESNRGRTSLSSPGASGSGSARPHPPLPPTPHPHSVNPSTVSLAKHLTSQSLVYSQSIAGTVDRQQGSTASSSDVRLSNLSASGTMFTSYPSKSLVPPMLFGRPGSGPVGLYGNGQPPHHGENLSSISPNIPISPSSMHSLPSLGQLQPLQPPQLPRSAAQHLRPFVPASLQPEQAGSLMQSPLQMQMQPQQLQVLQQPQVSPAHIYFQTPQSENLLHALQQQQTQHSQAQPPRQQGYGTSVQQDPAMTLQEYFRSPEAIQSLLSDRDKLTQLLEQHPKLMQMLQERLGQL